MRWLISVVLILASVFFAMLGLGIEMQVRELRDLMVSGTQAEGTITEQLGQRKSNAKFYSYRFRAGDREWTAVRRDIPYSAREIPIGARVPVRYDPANPERSVTPAELEEAEGWGNRLVFPLVALALLGWGAMRIVRRKT